MFKKLKKLFTLKKLLITTLAIFAIYSISLGLIVPWYVKSTVIPEQFAKFQLDASVKELSYNPFRQRLTMVQFSAKHDEIEYLGFDSMVVNINLSQIILGKGIIFDSFDLDHPRLYVERGPKGEINFVEILPETDSSEEKVVEKDAAEGDKEFVLPTIEFEHFAVKKGSLNFKDLTNAQPFDFALNDLSFVLPQFSTKHSLENQPKLSLISDTGMVLSWQGALQFNPLSSAGKITLEKLDLTPFAPYYEPWIHLDLASGRLGFEIDYQVDPLATKPKVDVTVQHFTLEDFLLREKGDQELVKSLPFFQIRELKWDLLEPSFIINELEIKDGHVVIERDKQGQVNILPPIKETPTISQKAQEAEEPSVVTVEKTPEVSNQVAPIKPTEPLVKPQFSNDLIGAIESLSWHLDKVWAQSWISAANDVYIHNYQITVEDDYIPGGMKLDINELSLRMKNLKNKRDEKASLDIAFKIDDQEQKINALFSPIPLKGELSTDLNQLPFEKFNSYVKSYSPYDLSSAKISLKTKTNFDVSLENAPKTSLQTNVAFTIDELDVKEKDLKQTLSFSQLEILSDMNIDKNLNLELSAKNKISIKGLSAKENEQKINLNFENLSFDNTADLKLDEKSHVDLKEQSLISISGLKAQENKQGLNVELAELTIDNNSTLKKGEALSLAGVVGVNLKGLDAEKTDKTLALKLKELALNSVKYDLDPLAVKISEIIITEAQASLIKEAAKQNKIAKAPSKKTEATEEKLEATEKNIQKALIETFQIADLIPLELEIDHIKVIDNKVSILDKTLFHEWSMDVDKINIDIRGFKSRGQDPVDFKMTAEIADLGELDIASKMMFNKPEIDGFFNLSLYMPLNSVSPYGVTYTHFPIDNGSLKFIIKSTIEQNALDGNLGAIINKIKLGEYVEADARAMSLPIKFAIALLQDSKGKIDFSDIPVHGDLADPQFRLWSLIWRTLKTICVKAVSSPFNYFASLVGASEDELEEISFKDGSARLSKSLEAQLRKVAEGLSKRPSLKLTMVEYGLSEKDLETLRIQKFKAAFAGFKQTKTKIVGHEINDLQSYYYTVFPEELPKLTLVQAVPVEKSLVMKSAKINEEKSPEIKGDLTSSTEKEMAQPTKPHKKAIWYLPWTWLSCEGKGKEKDKGNGKAQEVSGKTEMITNNDTIEKEKGAQEEKEIAIGSNAVSNPAPIKYVSYEDAEAKLLSVTNISAEEIQSLRKSRLEEMLNILSPKDKTRIKVKEKISDKSKSHFKMTIEQ